MSPLRLRRPLPVGTTQRIRRLVLAVLAAVALGVSVACPSMRSTGPVAIGLAIDTTRSGMLSIRRGAELALEQLNQEGRAAGTSFVLRLPPADATSAVQIAVALRDDPQIAGIVGHTDSGGTLEAAPIYADAENEGKNAVAAVAPTATSPRLTGLSPWIFRVCPSDVMASQAVARYALDSLSARTAAVIFRNDAFGKDWTAAFTATFERGGGEIVERAPYLSDRTEWEAYAGHLAELTPDVILFPGSHRDAEVAIRTLRAFGVRAPVIGSDAISELERSAAEFRGTRYTAFFDARRPPTPEGRRFVERYRKVHGDLPDQRAALAYDAAIVIGRAVLAAGADRAAVRDHIARIGSGLPAIAGATGAIAFDRRQDAVGKPVAIATVGR